MQRNWEAFQRALATADVYITGLRNAGLTAVAASISDAWLTGVRAASALEKYKAKVTSATADVWYRAYTWLLRLLRETVGANGVNSGEPKSYWDMVIPSQACRRELASRQEGVETTERGFPTNKLGASAPHLSPYWIR